MLSYNDIGRICGVDEAGRGPLAGPVTAAAVILNPNAPIAGLADSKKLSQKRREQLFKEIQSKAFAWAIGWASVEEIDTLNILQASLLAMKRAILQIHPLPVCIRIDGNKCPEGFEHTDILAIVKGDATVPAISAASILAKTARDAYMCQLHDKFPQYGFNKHMGYPTKMHLEALNCYGATIYHRRSFAPVRSAIAKVGQSFLFETK